MWETVHHLIRVLEKHGETAAAEIIAALGNHAETARELCYRLYTLSDRKKRAAEALYNTLVQSWVEIARLARTTEGVQTTLFRDESWVVCQSAPGRRSKDLNQEPSVLAN